MSRLLAIAFFGLALAASGCSPDELGDLPSAEMSADILSPSAASSRMIFPVQDPSNSQMDALLTGVLINEDGCLYVRGGGAGRTVLPIWRDGYDYSGSGEDVAILNASGKVVARVGQKISMGGGQAARPLHPTYRERVGHCRGPFWVAGDIST